MLKRVKTVKAAYVIQDQSLKAEPPRKITPILKYMPPLSLEAPQKKECVPCGSNFFPLKAVSISERFSIDLIGNRPNRKLSICKGC